MRAYWDERARLNAAWYVDTSLVYDEPDMERFFETGRRIVAEIVDGSPSAPVARELAVEIGPGLGRFCLALADRFARVVGVDISAEMVERAKATITNDRIEFVVGDGASLEAVDDGTADLVFSFTVFQHIPDVDVIERYISEAGRVLRSGGLFIFQWNNTPGHRRWMLRRRFLGLLDRLGIGERFGRNHAAFLGSRVPLDRITHALEGGGMRLAKTDGLDTLFAWAWAVRT